MDDGVRKYLRASIWRAEFLSGGLLKMAIGAAILFLIRWQQPMGFYPDTSMAIIWLILVIIFSLYSTYSITEETMLMIDDILTGEISPPDSINDVKLPVTATKGMLNSTGTLKYLRELFARAEREEFSKVKDAKGRIVYRTRGKDPRGPAKGGGAETFGGVVNRVDAMTPRPELEGIEGELTKTEKMVAEANEIAAAKALEEWEEAEANDPVLIEAGVKKLGDLVATGHFNNADNDD